MVSADWARLARCSMEQADQRSRQAVKALTDQAQEFGMGYSLANFTVVRTFRTPARPSRRIFLTHIRLDIARDFWHATLQRAG